MKIFETLGLRKTEGDVGIELEMEFKGARFNPRPPQPWTIHNEGSLRGGMEYVTVRPLFVDEKRKALDDLFLSLKDFKPIEKSPRTSVHVHVNVQQVEIPNFYSILVVYWLLENLLVNFCGETREGNLFCLRLKDADAVFRLACRDARYSMTLNDLFVRRGGERELRYAALNTSSLRRFGSLEFRSMRGTSDIDLIDMWSSALFSLCQKASKHLPNEIMDKYFEATKLEFLREFFDPTFVKELTKIKKWEGFIEENEGTVAELAYIRDWKTLPKVSTTKKRRAKKPIFRQEPPVDEQLGILPPNFRWQWDPNQGRMRVLSLLDGGWHDNWQQEGDHVEIRGANPGPIVFDAIIEEAREFEPEDEPEPEEEPPHPDEDAWLAPGRVNELVQHLRDRAAREREDRLRVNAPQPLNFNPDRHWFQVAGNGGAGNVHFGVAPAAEPNNEE